MSQMMQFVASHFRRLAMVWTSFGPISCLSTDQAFASCLVLQGLGVCYRASLEGSQHLGMACLFPSLPFLGLGLPLLFCYKRYWWLSGPFHLKRHQSPAAVAVITLSLSRKCMFPGSLSHHNKDLEQRILKPSVRHSSRVLDKPCYSYQDNQCYSSILFRRQQRRERERERERERKKEKSTRTWERESP